ncbi:hypothetical protein JL721_750 [Aureococcus anophagefferens]|nr:hypothetical protein JL721_750 [Aureococcus anophagefferens]
MSMETPSQEALLLIADYLERCTPCAGAAAALREDVAAHELLGRETRADGSEVPVSVASRLRDFPLGLKEGLLEERLVTGLAAEAKTAERDAPDESGGRALGDGTVVFSAPPPRSLLFEPNRAEAEAKRQADILDARDRLIRDCRALRDVDARLRALDLEEEEEADAAPATPRPTNAMDKREELLRREAERNALLAKKADLAELVERDKAAARDPHPRSSSAFFPVPGQPLPAFPPRRPPPAGSANWRRLLGLNEESPAREQRLGRRASLSGHQNFAVYSVAFDASGDFVVTGADDYLAKVWHAPSATLCHTLRGHKGVISDVAVSPCNLLVASASDDGTCRLHRLRDGLCDGAPVAVLTLTGDCGTPAAPLPPVEAIAFDDATGRLLATGQKHCDARAWDAAALLQGCEDRAWTADGGAWDALVAPGPGCALARACADAELACAAARRRRADDGGDAWRRGADADRWRRAACAGAYALAELPRRHGAAATDLAFSKAGDRLLSASVKACAATVWSWRDVARTDGGRSVDACGVDLNVRSGDEAPRELSAACWTCDDALIVLSSWAEAAKSQRPRLRPEAGAARHAPREQYLATDYGELVWDGRLYAVDAATRLPGHLAPAAHARNALGDAHGRRPPLFDGRHVPQPAGDDRAKGLARASRALPRGLEVPRRTPRVTPARCGVRRRLAVATRGPLPLRPALAKFQATRHWWPRARDVPERDEPRQRAPGAAPARARAAGAGAGGNDGVAYEQAGSCGRASAPPRGGGGASDDGEPADAARRAAAMDGAGAGRRRYDDSDDDESEDAPAATRSARRQRRRRAGAGQLRRVIDIDDDDDDGGGGGDDDDEEEFDEGLLDDEDSEGSTAARAREADEEEAAEAAAAEAEAARVDRSVVDRSWAEEAARPRPEDPGWAATRAQERDAVVYVAEAHHRQALLLSSGVVHGAEAPPWRRDAAASVAARLLRDGAPLRCVAEGQYEAALGSADAFAAGAELHLPYVGDRVERSRGAVVRVDGADGDGEPLYPGEPGLAASLYDRVVLDIDGASEPCSPWECEPLEGPAFPGQRPLPALSSRAKASLLSAIRALKRRDDVPTEAFEAPAVAGLDNRVRKNYLRVVPYPVDLQLLVDRLNGDYYRSLDAFRADAARIHGNSVAFNGSDFELTLEARELKDALLEAADTAARELGQGNFEDLLAGEEDEEDKAEEEAEEAPPPRARGRRRAPPSSDDEEDEAPPPTKARPKRPRRGAQAAEEDDEDEEEEDDDDDEEEEEEEEEEDDDDESDESDESPQPRKRSRRRAPAARAPSRRGAPPPRRRRRRRPRGAAA